MDQPGHRKQNQQRNNADSGHRPKLDAAMFGGVSRAWDYADVAECFVAAQAIGDESDHHTEPGGTEAERPTHPLAEDARDKRGDQGADVDSHVEDREAGVAARSALGIEITDDRRDVRLEESGAHHD